MIFHPAIIALCVASLLITFMLLYGASYGTQILRRWDIQSGSEGQLALERKTYLVSTFLNYVFGFELLSLFLFIFTVDHLHIFFVGAMCAAGSLHVNGYGYPALILKVVNFVFAGLWLILNYTDNKAYDYPLIKKKYLFLLLLTPPFLTEAVLQANYFFRLTPNIITSCCGSLFSGDGGSLTSEISSLPSIPAKLVFYLSMIGTGISGVRYYRHGKGGYLFSTTSAIAFFVSIASLISFISLYFYEMPSHHCPFCVLQGEYGYVGYPLYVALLGGAICGMGVGVLMPFRNVKSLSEYIPQIQRRLTLAALILFFLFAGIATYKVLFSGFVLEGY